MKKIKYFIIFFVLMFIVSTHVNAAASLSVSKSTVSVGGTFTTTVKLNNVAAWEVHVHSNGPVKNCSIDASDSTADASNGSKSYSVKCTATQTGTITITLSGNTTGESDDGATLISAKKTVTVVNKTTSSSNNGSTTVNSSDNSLSSLGVEGGELSPIFDPGTTEYNITMPKGSESVNITATPSHSKASVNGIGTVQVSEGINIVDVIVTAQNGYTKTYRLNITVEEDPISIIIDKKNYTMIKKEKDLPLASSSYSYATINYEYTIDGEITTFEIPAYYSEVTKYTLVGLKDENGQINLYIYDKKNNKFTLYNEFSFSPIIFYPTDAPKDKILDELKQTKIKLGETELDVYTYNEKSEYYLLYGINVETGEECWYQYDSKNNTIQRYDIDEVTRLIEKNNKLLFVVVLLSSICFIIMFFLLIFINKTINEK